MEPTMIQEELAKAVRTVRETNPLAASITNSVTINFVANTQLAVGGSAAMVYLADEAETVAQAGGALYVNLGTMMPFYEQTIPAAAKAMHELDRTLVFDPVAIGIGSLRTQLIAGLKDYPPKLIRGNASEIIALAALWGLQGAAEDTTRARGVDSVDAVDAAREAAVALARFTKGAVAVSGEVDLVTDGTLVARSYGGTPMFERVTGSGCSLGGVMAIYATAATPFIAALAGVQVYNLAGTRAAARTDAPGSFATAFIDELYKASAEDIAANRFELQEA